MNSVRSLSILAYTVSLVSGVLAQTSAPTPAPTPTPAPAPSPTPSDTPPTNGRNRSGFIRVPETEEQRIYSIIVKSLFLAIFVAAVASFVFVAYRRRKQQKAYDAQLVAMGFPPGSAQFYNASAHTQAPFFPPPQPGSYPPHQGGYPPYPPPPGPPLGPNGMSYQYSMDEKPSNNTGNRQNPGTGQGAGGTNRLSRAAAPQLPQQSFGNSNNNFTQ
ncbi:hypothetical protein DFS34DRAFT_686747 [Phlyctochytrium arcticum]|nr:hypothetical protein DFS34DRAFT_686747 [Phlyctochytrium arcticum]